MKTAREIAYYFLSPAHNGAMDDVSNLKLQKLLYYAQGYALAILGKPLFNDPIERWTHGPVVDCVYHDYKTYKANPIPPVINYDFSNFNDDEIIILKRVCRDYGQFAPWKLRDMTHEEAPWRDHPQAYYMTQNTIRDFFVKKLSRPQKMPVYTINFDLEDMKASIESGRVTVPKLNNSEDFVAWLNR